MREGLLAVALLHHHAGHALDAVSSVVLVVGLPGHVLQILHVRADEHVPQLHEIAVGRVLHCGGQQGEGEFRQIQRVARTPPGGAALPYLPRCPRGRDDLAPFSL